MKAKTAVAARIPNLQTPEALAQWQAFIISTVLRTVMRTALDLNCSPLA